MKKNPPPTNPPYQTSSNTMTNTFLFSVLTDDPVPEFAPPEPFQKIKLTVMRREEIDSSQVAPVPPLMVKPEYQNICHQCGRSYKWHYTLARHLKWECGKQPKFKCQFCSYRAKRKDNLDYHIANSHKDKEKPRQSHSSGASFL